jgi:hypothetical protein
MSPYTYHNVNWYGLAIPLSLYILFLQINTINMNQSQLKSSWEQGQRSAGSLYPRRLQHYFIVFFSDFSEKLSPSPKLPCLSPEGFCEGNVAFINLSWTDLAFILPAVPLQQPPRRDRSCQMSVRLHFWKYFVMERCRTFTGSCNINYVTIF